MADVEPGTPGPDDLPADGSALNVEGDQGGDPTPTPGSGADVDDAAAEVAKRTGPNAAHDNRFRHTFVLQPTDILGGDSWADAGGARDIHEANKVALLEQGLHRGLHARGDVEFEGEAKRLDGSVELTYSVAVVPTPADASATQTPTKELADLGGKTVNAEGTSDTVAGFDEPESTADTEPSG